MAVPSKSDLYPDPVAVATGVFGHDLGLGEGFEGAGILRKESKDTSKDAQRILRKESKDTSKDAQRMLQKESKDTSKDAQRILRKESKDTSKDSQRILRANSKDTSKDSKGILQIDSKDTTGQLQRCNETHKGHQENVKNTKGAPNLGGEWSPGEPAGSQDPRQTGALGPTDTEHRTDDAKDRAIDANANTERDGGRPPLKRQHSGPEVSEVVARPKLSRTVSVPGGQRWREIAEHEWPEGIAEAPAVKEARILIGRRSLRYKVTSKDAQRILRKESKDTSKDAQRILRKESKDTSKDAQRMLRKESKDTSKDAQRILRKESKDTSKDVQRILRKESKDTSKDAQRILRKESKDSSKDAQRMLRKESRDTSKDSQRILRK
ncbi:cylicin-1-like [Drosophila suzukii]|uniref:Cylicin-1-like n=1 Tax=Drosophila suzukii TaxID=28584 RepID=A0ABM4TXK7_DROSZ